MFDGPLSGQLGLQSTYPAAFEGLGKRDTAPRGKETTGKKDDMQLEERERKFRQTMTGTLNDSGAKRCIESGNLGIFRLLMNAVGLLSGSFSGTRCMHETRL